MKASPDEARSVLSKWIADGAMLRVVFTAHNLCVASLLVGVHKLAPHAVELALLDDGHDLSRLALNLLNVGEFDFTDEADKDFPLPIPPEVRAEEFVSALAMRWSDDCRCVLVELARTDDE